MKLKIEVQGESTLNKQVQTLSWAPFWLPWPAMHWASDHNCIRSVCVIIVIVLSSVEPFKTWRGTSNVTQNKHTEYQPAAYELCSGIL